MVIRYALATAACVLAAGICNARTTAKDTVKNVTLDTLSVSAPATKIYRASATKVWELKNTRIALKFNWKEKTADVHEWIRLRPYFYATDTLVLDAKSMHIDSIMLVNKKKKEPLQYTYSDDQVKIRFGKTYKMTDSIELYLVYTAMPYATSTGGSAAITDDRGLYFINTDYSVPHKPAQIWTQGETESNSHWMITVDKPNTRFTTQVELTIPDSMVSLSNGALVKKIKEKGGMRTDIWKMDMPIQAYAVMFAIGRYDIVKDHWKNKEMNYYVEPQYGGDAKEMFANTAAMIDFFSRRTGVIYPWNKYDQVVVRDYVSGAMENTTASLFGEFMNGNKREIADNNARVSFNPEDVVSHELFHMWFGDYVTCESWSNITVNESFANYGEQLWRTYKYGKASGEELAYSDLHQYLQGSMASDPQLVRFYYGSREEVFDHVSYNKGGAILHYMNDIMGDAAFDRSMNIYLTKNALHSAEAHNWRLAIEEATGQDWNWFFNEWYFHAGHPVLKINYNYDDADQKLIVTVAQTQDDSTMDYDLPMKTAVIYGNEKTVIDWRINKRKESFTYAYKGGQKPVIVPDYDHVVPGDIKENKKPAQWLTQYAACNDYVSRRQAVSASGRLLSDSASQAIIDMALNDELGSIRRLALAELENTESSRYQRKWTPKVMAMATGDKDRTVRAAAFSVLGEWKVGKAEGEMLQELNDSSYMVDAEALKALDKISKDTAYALAEKLEKTAPAGELQTAIWSEIGKKGADNDVVIFEQDAPYIFGQKKFSLAFSLNNYLKNVKSDESFNRAVAVYTNMVLTENSKSYRAALGGFMFQAADDVKDNTKSDKAGEAAVAKARLAILKKSLEKIVAEERDNDTKKDFEKSMKTLSE